jgi:hypothetical protein
MFTIFRGEDFVHPSVIFFLVAYTPNAKAKRKLEVTSGTNYRLKCRATGSPPPIVKWYKGDEELDSSKRGIRIKYNQ